MAFWTTFLALALGPLDQFQKNFLGTIYQIWWGIGPIFTLLGPKMELHYKGIKWLLLYKGRDHKKLILYLLNSLKNIALQKNYENFKFCGKKIDWVLLKFCLSFGNLSFGTAQFWDKCRKNKLESYVLYGWQLALNGYISQGGQTCFISTFGGQLKNVNSATIVFEFLKMPLFWHFQSQPCLFDI